MNPAAGTREMTRQEMTTMMSTFAEDSSRGEFYELRITRSSTRGLPTSTVLAHVTKLSHPSMHHTRDRRIWSIRSESYRLRKETSFLL